MFNKAASAHFPGDVKEMPLMFFPRPWKGSSSPTPHTVTAPGVFEIHWDWCLDSWEVIHPPLCGEICLPACDRSNFVPVMECSSLTVWCLLCFIFSFPLFSFLIHLIYPQACSSSAQAHSLSNYLGRTLQLNCIEKVRSKRIKADV